MGSGEAKAGLKRSIKRAFQSQKLTWLRSFSCKTGSSAGGMPAAIFWLPACCHLLYVCVSVEKLRASKQGDLGATGLLLKLNGLFFFCTTRHFVGNPPNVFSACPAARQPPRPLGNLVFIFVFVPIPTIACLASSKQSKGKAKHATLPSRPGPHSQIARTNRAGLSTLIRCSQTFLPAPIHKTQVERPLRSSMAGSASSPFLLALAFLFAFVCSLISSTDGAELVPDQWHEFEVPVVPEDKVRARIIE